MSNSIRHQSLKIGKLKSNFKNHIYAIPDIQRDYVWDKKRVLAFADSIVRGYPVGVFLVWKTSSKLSGSIKMNKNSIIPTANIRNKHIEYIIDGQQRLTSLYGILYGVESSNSKFINFKKIALNFDENSKLNSEKYFKFLSKYEDGRNEVLLTDVLNKGLAEIKKYYGLSNYKLKVVERVKRAFNSYHFYSLIIESDKMSDVQETFIRINSQGMTVSKADRLFAQMTKVDLRNSVASLKKSQDFLDGGFDLVPDQNFLYSVALELTEDTKIGDIVLRNLHKKYEKDESFQERFKKNWKQYQVSFYCAISFIKNELDIQNYSDLPYANIFTMLTYFFMRLKKRRPTSKQIKEIKRWFWHTSLGDRYSGQGLSRNIADDIKFFRSLVKSSKRYSVGEKIPSREFFSISFNSANSAQVKAFRLFLKSKKPRYFETGELMNFKTDHIKDRRDKHHIFPKEYLSPKKINKKFIHCLSNLCLLSSNENKSIGKLPPRSYPEKFSKKKFYQKVLRSHFILKDGIYESDIRKGLRDFFNARNQLLVREISKSCNFRVNELFTPLDPIKKIY